MRHKESLISHYGVCHLFCAGAVVKQLNSTQLEDLVQEGRRLVDVDRHGSLACWISHRFIEVLQPAATWCKQTHTFSAVTKLKFRACGGKELILRVEMKMASVPLCCANEEAVKSFLKSSCLTNDAPLMIFVCLLAQGPSL